MRNPPYPDVVIEELSERLKKGDVTLSKAEVEQIIAMLDILSNRCGEAYQVVGALANFADMHDDLAVIKAMDLLAFPLNRGEILPFNPERYRELARAEQRRKKFDAKMKADLARSEHKRAGASKSRKQSES
jgi:hypothetical protein